LVPVIYLLVAAVFQQIWWAWERAWGEKRWRPLAIGLTAAVLLVVIGNINTYFRVQAVDPAVWGAYSPNESAVGKYLAEVPEDIKIYMTPQYTHHSAVAFIGGPRDITVLNLAQHIPLREDPGGDVLFILEPVDERLIPLLQQLYPGGQYEVHQDRYGRVLFLSYWVPRASLDAARGLQTFYSPVEGATTPPVAGGQTHALDFDYATNPPPVPPPFQALYQGALLVPQYGKYTFELTATGGEAVLYLDEVEALRVSEGSERLTRTLPGGFQGIRVEYVSGPNPGQMRLSWITPQNPNFTIIDAANLYTLPGASNGLVGYYYANPDWSDPPSLIQRDLFILPNNILREPFSIRWVGKVAAPTAGRYVFGTRSDDGSFVYVDGQLVVDNGGSHGAQYREGVIELSEGFHDIEVLYNELGGSREMQLWWQPPGGAKGIIPSEYLFPVEENLPEGLTLPPPPVLAPPVVEAPPAAQPEPAPQPQQPPAPAPVQPIGDFPATEPAVLWTFGTCGAADDQLQKPIGVAVAPDGHVYVADMGNRRVVHLGPDGEFINAWGETGEGPGQFTEPFDLVIAGGGEIAVLDAVNQVISVWTPQGGFKRQFGAELTMYRPRGMGLAPNGEYFIADTGGVRILQVAPDGRLVNQFGGPEDELGPGQPTDVAVGPSGIAYVAEPIAGLLWRLDTNSGQKQPYPGPEANTIESPHLAVGADGRIYLTDPEGGRVLVYEPSMTPLAQFGTRGAEPGQFGRPVGIAVAADGTIYTADPDLCRVTAFSALP
ncbi:MAG: hypothetical protein GXP42_07090, partial [Chloroflexi bacterium]|nr:hypothetical protein [Chloroflexota bacterium]